MRDLVVTLIVFGSIPFILVRPYIGALMFTWLGFMNPHRLSFGFAYEFPFAQIIAFVTIFAFLYYRYKTVPKFTPILLFWGLYILWTAITSFNAIYPEVAIESWYAFMKIVIMCFLTLFMIDGKARIDALIWTIVGSIGFFAVKGGIFTIMTAGSDIVWGPPGSFLEDNNALAVGFIMTLPLMRYLWLNSKNTLIRKMIIGGMLLTVFAILGTHSRGALLGIIAMTVFLIMKGRHKLMFGIAILVLAPLVITFMPQKWHDRMATITNYEEDESAMGRITAWKFAIALADERPIAGGGYGTFTQELFDRYSDNPELYAGSHSIYFENLGEHGYVGLALFLFLGIYAYLSTRKVIKLVKGHEDLIWAKDLAAMIQVSLVGYAVTGSFLELGTFDLYYFLLVIAIALNTTVHQTLRAAEESKENKPIEVEGVEIVGIGQGATRPA